MLTVELLRPVFRAGWGPDTCDPHDLMAWRPSNPSRGQCGTTALVLQDLLGGDLVLGQVHVDGRQVGYHWWNRLPDGTVVDLTAEQFLSGETVTGAEIRQRPADGPRRCQGQYALLRHRVRTALKPLQVRDIAPSRIAVAALTDPTGAVLLLPPDANRTVEPGQWALPGGHVAPEEPPAEAAARELAGLVVRDLRAIWTDRRPDLHAFIGTAIGPGRGPARFVQVAELSDLNLGPTTAAVLHRLRVTKTALQGISEGPFHS